MTDLQTYRVSPRAPLVFRSGKPFLAGTREKAQYPWPSAWAGLMRTRYMDQHGLGPQDRERLIALPAAGALLARRDAGTTQLYLPKPADALALRDEASFLALAPLAAVTGTGSDLPEGLRPVGLASAQKGKPQASAPYWPLGQFIAWARGEPVTVSNAKHLPVEETRTHVGISGDSGAAETGKLFQTTGLDFAPQRWHESDESRGDWVFVGQGPRGLAPGLVVFGGERRLSQLDAEDSAIWQVPEALRAPLVDARGLALTLATPAVFASGWRPGWLDDGLVGRLPGTGLTLRLHAALVERWQPISGWDLQAGRPKPMRRAVAAGATYWFEVLEGGIDPAALWLAAVSDDAQDRRDGFGLAVFRPWNPDL